MGVYVRVGWTMGFVRLVALALVVGLAGCAKPEKPVFEAFDFDYLTKIKLDVGAIEVDDGWVPRGSARHVEYLAPTRPVKAMRMMAEQRLVPGGTAGTAVVRVDDGSIILYRGRFEGSFAVHMEVLDGEGQQVGMVNARVRDSEAAKDEEDVTASQVDIETLMRRMMGKLNVEFEYQVRRALKGKLQTTVPAAPKPEAVDAQDLTGVPAEAAAAAAPAAVAPAAGVPAQGIPAVVAPDPVPVQTMSPPPSNFPMPLKLAPPARP